MHSLKNEINLKLLAIEDLKLHELAKASAAFESRLLREAKSSSTLRKYDDAELHSSTQTTVETEREATLNVLRHLSEVERRRLHAQFACDSLFAYCVSELKMSEPHAARRVNASRLIRELPQLETKMASGALSLTAVSQAHSFFRKEAKAGNVFSSDRKIEVIAELESQPTRRADQILLARASDPTLHFKEVVKPVSDQMTEIRVTVDAKLFADLTRLKEIWSHAIPDASYADLLRKLCDVALAKCDPDEIAKRSLRNALPTKAEADSSSSEFSTSTPAPELRSAPAPESSSNPTPSFKIRSRYVPSPVRHAVWVRDGGRCTFTDDRTGKTCESKHQIELDHVIAFAAGGENTEGNLRLRCRTHNLSHAAHTFGEDLMRNYRRH